MATKPAPIPIPAFAPVLRPLWILGTSVDVAVGVVVLLLAVVLVDEEVDVVVLLLVLVLSAHVFGVAAAFEVTVNENPLSPPWCPGTDKSYMRSNHKCAGFDPNKDMLLLWAFKS